MIMNQTTEERLVRIAPLSKGLHEPPDNGGDIEASVMEAVAYVAGEQWSDHPHCACPVISAFLRTWNDDLPDEDRDRLLWPLIPALIGTRADSLGLGGTAAPRIEHRRAALAMDWLVREYTSTWLRLAGLATHTEALASLPEITGFDQCPSLMPIFAAAKNDMDAAKDASADAAWTEVLVAARNVTRAGIWETVWTVSGATAGDAARVAASGTVTGTAALDAAWTEAIVAAMDTSRVAAWTAAGDASEAAAWTAAWTAAGDATMVTAGDRADPAVWTTARATARDAARYAARDTAWAILRPTTEQLQLSAVQLVHHMIAVESA